LAIEWARKNDAESKGRCVFVWSVRTAGESKYFPTFKTAILLNVSLTNTNQPT
jgi:hypothetical protein